MAARESPTRPLFGIIPLLVYPLVGPAAVALVIAVPLAILGLFILGPGGLVYYLFLAAWWLPGLYKLLGPPFLLTRIGVALAGLFVPQRSIILALIAAELAFSLYFGIWILIPGGVEIVAPDYANFSAGIRGSPWSVLFVLAATAVCWFVMRKLERSGSQARPDSSRTKSAAR